MEIDIENGDALGAGIAEPLGGECGIVEEAIAAIEIAMGVMAGRAAQRESRRRAGGDMFGSA